MMVNVSINFVCFVVTLKISVVKIFFNWHLEINAATNTEKMRGGGTPIKCF